MMDETPNSGALTPDPELLSVGRKRKVLIVEDEYVNREILSAYGAADMTPQYATFMDPHNGYLDVAAHFFAPDAGEKKWDVIYVNAYPSREWGYNDLPTLKAQEELFQSVLEGMRRFSPAHFSVRPGSSGLRQTVHRSGRRFFRRRRVPR